jgi:putative membrane protein
MFMKKIGFTVAVALSMAIVPALAKGVQQSNDSKSGRVGQLNAAPDRKFVMEAARGGMAEVELGRLAAEKGSSDQVKKFGQRMVDDHSKAGDELKTLAGNKNITLPTDVDAKDKMLRLRLSKLSGDAFDRAYIKAMVTDHRKDVNEFRTVSRSAKDPDVKAWASKTLPTLEEHLKLAQDTNRAVAVGTSGLKK